MTYSSISTFSRTHHLQSLPRPRDSWRILLMPVTGEITGLGNVFRGLAVATNGVIVAIESSAGAILFGHLQWFEKDDPEEESDIDNVKSVFASRKRMQTIAEFEDCFI